VANQSESSGSKWKTAGVDEKTGATPKKTQTGPKTQVGLIKGVPRTRQCKTIHKKEKEKKKQLRKERSWWRTFLAEGDAISGKNLVAKKNASMRENQQKTLGQTGGGKGAGERKKADGGNDDCV